MITKETAAQFLPLIQAMAEGKTIQFKPSLVDHWKDIERMDAKTWDSKHFRIKPEPREWEAWVSRDGTIYDSSRYLQQSDDKQRIRVREVID